MHRSWFSTGPLRYLPLPLLHPIAGMALFLLIYVFFYYRYWNVIVVKFVIKSGLAYYLDYSLYIDCMAYVAILSAFIWPAIFMTATFDSDEMYKYKQKNAISAIPTMRRMISIPSWFLLILSSPTLFVFFIAAGFASPGDNNLNSELFKNLYLKLVNNITPMYVIIAFMIPAILFYLIYLTELFWRMPASVLVFIQRKMWGIYS